MATSATGSVVDTGEQLKVSDEFRRSCARWMEYPTNSIRKTIGMSPSTLEEYRNELSSAEGSLFQSSEDNVEVCFRDFGGQGMAPGGLSKLRAHSEERMWQWLGIETNNSPDKEKMIIRESDPKSRFIYIYAPSPRGRLSITRSMLAMILSFHQVMPEYLDFIGSFSIQPGWITRFTGFRARKDLEAPPPMLVMEGLKRSGQQFEVVYNLKGVTMIRQNEWVIRNAVFYHRFDLITARAVWIVTKAGLDILGRYKDLTSAIGRQEDRSFDTLQECFIASLSPHVLFCHWSSENWRRYIRHLEGLGLQSDSTPSNASYQVNHLREMQICNELVNEALGIVEGNMNVVRSLREFYFVLSADEDLPLEFRVYPATRSTIGFLQELDALTSEWENLARTCKDLEKMTANRTELIRQHLELRTSERSLRLSERMEQEAVVMRIVTLVTLIYLPATFVSTFFSTDVVKYQEDDYPNGRYSKLAMVRWLQVTLPLTFVTLFAAWMGMRWSARSSRDDWATARSPSAKFKLGGWVKDRWRNTGKRRARRDSRGSDDFHTVNID
ncbi:hypothetical protein QBC44DRAFT_251306 [Cladorrhinum sp. PSN332]|nr:hypothetical protein QBC44DRAFT_251306 [Cladorrhinum sp. PSN332]